MTVICRHTTAAAAATTVANTTTTTTITITTTKINSERPTTDVSIFCFHLPSFLLLNDFCQSTQLRITEDFNISLFLVMTMRELDRKPKHNPFMFIISIAVNTANAKSFTMTKYKTFKLQKKRDDMHYSVINLLQLKPTTFGVSFNLSS